MFLNESAKKWSSILTEELGIKDQNKLNWMSNLATVHELYEGLQANASVDGGTFQPVGYGEQLLIVKTDVVLLIKRVDGLHRIEQTLHGCITGVWRDAVVEVFQEV